MEAFNILKSACWTKKVVSFNQLPVGEYPVSEFMLVQTRFGQTLKVDLGDKIVYLPTRFGANMTDETVAALNTVPQILTYSGKDPQRHNL